MGEERGRARGKRASSVTVSDETRRVAKAGERTCSPTLLLHLSYYDMWPFKSKKSAPEPLETPARLEKLEHDMRRLQEEWTEVYHKFRTLQLRVSKQVQRLDANSSTQEEPQGAESDGAKGTPTASSLSPRLQRIQNEIMERRRRGAPSVAKEGGE